MACYAMLYFGMVVFSIFSTIMSTDEVNFLNGKYTHSHTHTHHTFQYPLFIRMTWGKKAIGEMPMTLRDSKILATAHFRLISCIYLSTTPLFCF